MTEPNEPRLCFVIGPIGDDGSDIRRRSDQVLNYIIEPVVRSLGYETPIRADRIAEPGVITSQIIQHIINDSLVVADLTGKNANVFYELAIRHAIRKPVVQIIQEGENIPFDVAQHRTIYVDHTDLDSVEACKGHLADQVRALEANPTNISSPISTAIDTQVLRQSSNPLEQNSAEIMTMLESLSAQIADLRKIQGL